MDFALDSELDPELLSLKRHAEWKGKLSIESKADIKTKEDLAMMYTPWAAEPCLEIAADEKLAYTYTGKCNTVAVITDGSEVLGLGNIGPAASMPIMEAKCALFKKFANIDAVPICIDSNDVDVIVETIYNISKSFGGINLEDISAPRCFEIERRLIEKCDIPVFHDDMHGTAIVVCAALRNAVRVVGKELGTLKIVINGAGAEGIGISGLLTKMGFGNIILCDREGMLAYAIKGADAFIGVSEEGALTKEMVQSMAEDAIVFAMANPVPEIMPDEAEAAGARVVGTGRADFPNQINNMLAFPGIFRGVLDAKAHYITEEMKIAAVKELAFLAEEDGLSEDNILPDVFDTEVVDRIAAAIVAQTRKDGIA